MTWCQYHLDEHIGELENPYSPFDPRYYTWVIKHSTSQAEEQYPPKNPYSPSDPRHYTWERDKAIITAIEELF